MNEDAANGTLSSTQFNTVMGFGKNCAVYLIYDFYFEDEYLEERRKIVDEDWGYLPSDLTNQRISLAKIADQITDLRFGSTFDFAEALDYPVELVRAVKTSEDIIIRIAVA